MMRVRLAAVCLACAVAAGVPSSAAAQAAAAAAVPTMPWQAVDHIVTASVIDVRGVGVVRLAGVEEGDEVSRAFLAGLISSRAVHVVPTAHSTGLTEALVYTPDGRCVNAEMIRFGYARARNTPGFDRAAEFRGLEEDARRLKRGLWGAPAQAAASPQASRPRRDARFRRFYIGAGGGAVLQGVRDWTASVEAGVAVSSSFGLYLSAGHLHDIGDAGTEGDERAWHGGGGLRLTLPLRIPIRPYVKGGGGYMRIVSDGPDGGGPKRDEPFWEAGAGLLTAAGPVHFDAGYTFARVGRIDIARVTGVLGIRF
ncbi:MAG: thermonuclease family protein [Acidobacteria bacterium]|nr:thermonuclease family protein [Acidobacteriota bacterium]